MNPFAFYLLLVISATFSTATIAGNLEQKLNYSVEGETVHIDVVDAPLGALLDELASKQNALIEWPPGGASQKLVTLRFSGSFHEAVQRLLGQMNYIVVQDLTGETAGVVRVTVFATERKAKGESEGFANGDHSRSLVRQPKPPDPTPRESFTDGMIIVDTTIEFESTATMVEPPTFRAVKTDRIPDGMTFSTSDLPSGVKDTVPGKLGSTEN